MELIQGRRRELYQKTEVLVCSSGTTTLEALLYNVPMIVLGALSPLTYFIAKYIVRLHLPFIALPNIIAQKEIVPEIKQFDLKSDKVAGAVLDLLKKSNQTEMIENYESVKIELSKDAQPLSAAAECIIHSVRN
ncbi:hypothetical protein ACFL96_08160 [Thermoproteota archaeon]